MPNWILKLFHAIGLTNLTDEQIKAYVSIPKGKAKTVRPIDQDDQFCPNCTCIHCKRRFVTGMVEHLIKCPENKEGKQLNYE